MYRVILEKSVQKFLQKHRGEKLIAQFTDSLRILAIEPYENSLDIKVLVGLPNAYRLRIGKYRFLYEIIEETIVINFFDAGSRGDIYNK